MKQERRGASGRSSPVPTTDSFLRLHTRVGKTLSVGDPRVPNVSYVTLYDGTIVVSHLLLKGDVGTKARELKAAHTDRRRGRRRDDPFPHGVKRLTTKRLSEPSADGEFFGRERGGQHEGTRLRYSRQETLLRYQPQWQVPYLSEDKQVVKRFYWTGGNYSDPWVAGAITALVEEAVNAASTERRATRGDERPSTQRRYPKSEVDARKAIATVLTKRGIAPLKHDGTLQTNPTMVPPHGSTDVWEQLVTNEFKAFLDTDRTAFFEQENYTAQAVAEAKTELDKLALAARGHGAHVTTTPVPLGSIGDADPDDTIDVRDLLALLEPDENYSSSRGRLHKPRARAAARRAAPNPLPAAPNGKPVATGMRTRAT